MVRGYERIEIYGDKLHNKVIGFNEKRQVL